MFFGLLFGLKSSTGYLQYNPMLKHEHPPSELGVDQITDTNGRTSKAFVDLDDVLFVVRKALARKHTLRHKKLYGVGDADTNVQSSSAEEETLEHHQDRQIDLDGIVECVYQFGSRATRSYVSTRDLVFGCCSHQMDPLSDYFFLNNVFFLIYIIILSIDRCFWLGFLGGGFWGVLSRYYHDGERSRSQPVFEW